MERENQTLSKEEVISLKSRWYEKDIDGSENALQKMTSQLTNECKKNNYKRPLKLDLRGISLLNQDLSGLDLSGYDLSYANLNQSNLTGTALSYSKFYKASLEQAIFDECGRQYIRLY